MNETEQTQVDAVISEYALDRLLLRFSNPTIEQGFEDESLLASMHFIRAYVIGGILIYIAFGILDFITNDVRLGWIWFMRYGLVCPILIGIFIATFFPIFHRISQPLLSLAMLSSGFSIVVMTAIMQAPFNTMYYVGIIIVVSYCGNLIRLRFVNSTLCAWMLFAAYQIVCLKIAPIPWRIFVANDFFLGSATLVGMLGSYIQELYFRRSYVGQKVVEAKNRLTADLLVESQKANRAKSNFLANMSHELRTPLNAVIGFSDIIKMELHGTIGDQRYAEYAGDIHKSGMHLLAIINDILSLSKAESGKLSLSESRFSLNCVIGECLRICRNDADSRRVRLEFAHLAPDIELLGDERLFLQILMNLVSNGVKFTPAEGSVSIRCEIERTGCVVVEVADTGIGIAPEDLERVLRPFEQVSGTYSRNTGGTGLGLPIVKRFVELHNGSLSLKSELEKGTVVRVTFPAERHAPPNCEAAAGTQSDINRLGAAAYG